MYCVVLYCIIAVLCRCAPVADSTICNPFLIHPSIPFNIFLFLSSAFHTSSFGESRHGVYVCVCVVYLRKTVDTNIFRFPFLFHVVDDGFIFVRRFFTAVTERT